MTFTPADLDSAIDKLGKLNFSDAETEAIAHALGSAGEVEGFGRAPQRPGQGFLLEVSGLLGTMPTSRPAPPTNDVVQSTVVAR